PQRRHDHQRDKQQWRSKHHRLGLEHGQHYQTHVGDHAAFVADRRLVVPDQGHILDEDRILMTKNKGQALVEFALVFPLLFFILAISIDVFRVDWVTSTVAEAARQAARQAVPNQVPPDNPFGSATGSCSGTTLTPGANGAGTVANNTTDVNIDVSLCSTRA